MNEEKTIKVSEQLQEVLSDFDEWEKKVEGNCLILTFMDGDGTTEITLELNEYGNVISATYIVTDEEIVTPASCHECYDTCEYYSEDECLLSDEKIESEISEWLNAPRLKTPGIEIGRTTFEIKCYLNVPHYHLYKAYVIDFKDANNLSFRDLFNVIDLIIELYEEYVEKVRK